MRTARAAIRETFGGLQLRNWDEPVGILVNALADRLRAEGYDLSFQAYQAQSGPIRQHFGELQYYLIARKSKGKRNFLSRRSESYYCVAPLSHVTNDSFKKLCELSGKYAYANRLTKRQLHVKVIAITVGTNVVAASSATQRAPKRVNGKSFPKKLVWVQSAILDISNFTVWSKNKNLKSEIESL